MTTPAPPAADAIDTINDSGVSVTWQTKGNAPELVLLLPPRPGERIDREKAFRLAAWIVVILEADEREPAERGPTFEEVLEAVRNT